MRTLARPDGKLAVIAGTAQALRVAERRWLRIAVAGRTFPGEFPGIEVPGDELDAGDFRVDERDTAEHRWPASTRRSGVVRQKTPQEIRPYRLI
jgi:hypothetical protein